MPKCTNWDIDLVKYLYLDEKKSIKEIAIKFNAKECTVHNFLTKHKINRRGDPIRKKIDKNILYDLYTVKCKSKQQIADILNVSVQTVSKNIKQYKLEHETPEIIKNIIDLYISGKSTTQIAKIWFRPKSRIRQILLNNNIVLRDKYNCHTNDIGGEILNPDVFRSSKATWLKRKCQSFFKEKIAIPMKKEQPYCSLCGSKEHLHVHHLNPLSCIINKIVSENLGKSDKELYKIVINDSRYLDRENMIVVCEKCHYTVYHPYVNYHVNQQPSVNNEGSETIRKEYTQVGGSA